MKTALQIFWGEFRSKYQGWFTLVVALIAVGLWVLSPFVSQIKPELATGVSLSALVVILAMALDHLITVRKEMHLATFYPDQMSADDDTMKLIQKEKVQLIEYSSWNANRILYRLKEMKADIELLICNPNFTITSTQERSFHSSKPGSKDFQKELRVCPAIRQLGNIILRDYDKAKIKCYRTPGSIRGRNFGDRWIQVGWYTYQTSGERKIFGSPQIWGDINPLITAPTSCPEGLALKNMFNGVFEKMWKESVTLQAVCGKCPKKADCFGSQAAARQWLKLVSSRERKYETKR